MWTETKPNEPGLFVAANKTFLGWETEVLTLNENGVYKDGLFYLFIADLNADKYFIIPDPDGEPNPQTPAEIMGIVAQFFGVTCEQIKSPLRKKELCIARKFFWLIVRDKTNLSAKSIGLMSGFRDHSTVLTGINTVVDWMERDKGLREVYKQILKRIK